MSPGWAYAKFQSSATVVDQRIRVLGLVTLFGKEMGMDSVTCLSATYTARATPATAPDKLNYANSASTAQCSTQEYPGE